MQLRRTILQPGERDYTFDELKRMARHAFGAAAALVVLERGFAVGRFTDGFGQSPVVPNGNGGMRALRMHERRWEAAGWGPTWAAAFLMAARRGIDFG